MTPPSRFHVTDAVVSDTDEDTEIALAADFTAFVEGLTGAVRPGA